MFLAGLVCASALPQGPPADAIARDMLAAHNAARARVGVPPLTWSDTLKGMAQQWADSLLADGTFRLIDYKLGWPPNRSRAGLSARLAPLSTGAKASWAPRWNACSGPPPDSPK